MEKIWNLFAVWHDFHPTDRPHWGRWHLRATVTSMVVQAYGSQCNENPGQTELHTEPLIRRSLHQWYLLAGFQPNSTVWQPAVPYAMTKSVECAKRYAFSLSAFGRSATMQCY